MIVLSLVKFCILVVMFRQNARSLTLDFSPVCGRSNWGYLQVQIGGPDQIGTGVVV